MPRSGLSPESRRRGKDDMESCLYVGGVSAVATSRIAKRVDSARRGACHEWTVNVLASDRGNATKHAAGRIARNLHVLYPCLAKKLSGDLLQAQGGVQVMWGEDRLQRCRQTRRPCGLRAASAS